ncbi:hypothetical protein FSP39_011791 [Pinctada imbricata]|uniref:BZIP domain-containing protein n=1 Tax=Pinctada imbricata TaxID=66713 RepID=A0AA88YSJ5_PINIB|nr:hypothetical protein FSP39_011791 [Pinctada imbricata]
MTDSGYCEFPPGMDSAMIAHINNYTSRHSGSSYDGSHPKPSGPGPGFYQEHFGQYNTVEEMAKAMQSVAQSMASHHQAAMAGATSSTATTAAAGLFEPHIPINYAMKPEKSLPPTPPGSPGERSPQRSRQLAKPVPVRQPSEKTMGHAHNNLSTSPETMYDQGAFYGHAAAAAASTSPTLARALAAVQQTQKRPRSEKKPIPSEQKDTKYFERRRRNNQAAKKSRDARKAREDEIAIRASFLEKENAILRAQVATLREEANSLKQLLLQKRSR